MKKNSLASLLGTFLGAIVLTIVIFGLPQGIYGQQSSLGTLTGTVTDVSGAVIPGAKVVATDVETNESQQTVTTSVGSYTIPGLRPDNYAITVQKQGFETETMTGVVVFTAQESTANVVLQVGSTATKVTVVDQAPLINTNSAEQTHNLEYDLIRAIPYSEEDVLDSLVGSVGYQGGTSPGGEGGETPGSSTSYITPGFTIQLGGSRMGTYSYLVDGSDNVLTSYQREGMVFSAEDVTEVSTLTNGIPAQYGRTGGGVINVASRGGSNAFHGSLMWRHTDPSMEAFTLDSITSPQLHRNLFGIYAGGPVYIPKVYNGRNKTFFFVDVEPYRESNYSGGYGKVYTPDELAANYYNAYNLINTTVLASSGPIAALAAARTGGVYYQFPTNSAGFPIGSRYASSSQYVPIPAGGTENLPYYLGAQLAANPLASYLTSLFPTPQNPGPFFTFQRPDGLWLNNGSNVWNASGVKDANNRYGIRMDQQFSSNDHLFVRFGREPLQAERESQFANNLPYDPSPWDNISTNNVALNEVHVISPHMVNELHASYLHLNFWRHGDPTALSKDWGPTLGLFSSINGAGFPGMGIGGDNNLSVGYANGFLDIDANVGLGDDLTWTIGRHTLRMGIDLRHYQTNYYNQTGVFGGSYGWGSTNNGSTGGVSLAGIDLGILSSYSNAPQPVSEYYRYHYYGTYIQDDIKIRKNLTLNVGLRWEFETPRMEKYNHQGTFLPNLTGTLNGQTVTGAWCFSGSCGLPTTLWPANYHGFEPRLGLAYSPKPWWTIRAAYSLLRAPISSDFGYGNFPDFNISESPVGGQYGGTNPNAWVDIITNPPTKPTQGFPNLSGGPYFTMYPVSVPYTPQTNAVPFVHQWELDTQFQVTRNDMFDLAYVGNHAGHLAGQNGNGSYSIAYNVPNLQKVIALGEANTNWTTLVNNPYGIATDTGTVVTEGPEAALDPYQGFFYANLYGFFNRDYDSEYDALYFSWSHRTSYGLYLNASVTWQKVIDDATDVNGSASGFGGGYYEYQNPFNLHGERALSADELPWMFPVEATYQLPVGKGRMIAPGNKWVNGIVGNWVTSGTFQWWGGYPVTVQANSPGYFTSISPTNGSYGNYLPSEYNLRPNRVPGVPMINPSWRQDPKNIPYLNAAAFSMPGALDAPAFGNLGRSICCGPRELGSNLSLQKRFPLRGEQRYFQLEGDAFSWLNHPQFSFNPNSGHTLFSSFNTASITNTSVPPFTYQATFGYPTFGGARTLQLGLRLVW